MLRPELIPIGLQLNRTARVVGRAFDDALTEAGGSLPVWLVLLNLTIRTVASQRELARAVGVSPRRSPITSTRWRRVGSSPGGVTRRTGATT